MAPQLKANQSDFHFAVPSLPPAKQARPRLTSKNSMLSLCVERSRSQSPRKRRRVGQNGSDASSIPGADSEIEDALSHDFDEIVSFDAVLGKQAQMRTEPLAPILAPALAKPTLATTEVSVGARGIADARSSPSQRLGEPSTPRVLPRALRPARSAVDLLRQYTHEIDQRVHKPEGYAVLQHTPDTGVEKHTPGFTVHRRRTDLLRTPVLDQSCSGGSRQHHNPNASNDADSPLAHRHAPALRHARSLGDGLGIDFAQLGSPELTKSFVTPTKRVHPHDRATALLSQWSPPTPDSVVDGIHRRQAIGGSTGSAGADVANRSLDVFRGVGTAFMSMLGFAGSSSRSSRPPTSSMTRHTRLRTPRRVYR
ncbi:hypothetical protein PYCC9005_004277 [Savitreella phatthalungensis]